MFILIRFFLSFFPHLSMCSLNYKCAFNNEEILIQKCVPQASIFSPIHMHVARSGLTSMAALQTALWKICIVE